MASTVQQSSHNSEQSITDQSGSELQSDLVEKLSSNLLTELLEQLDEATTYLDANDRERLHTAFYFAEDAHREQKRKSGEPYITHPVAVTEILGSYKFDIDALLAGLLHDTVEDTEVDFETIERLFGPEVRVIVEGETKISKLKFQEIKDEDAQAENLRRMLLAMVNDMRIILVKLADRLHNMRTLQHMSPEKQKRISNETLEIFAPLASLLGVNPIKVELEDLCFQYIYPEEYKTVAKQVKNHTLEREEQLEQSINLLQNGLTKINLETDIAGRTKHLYSIFQKMRRDQKTLSQIFDLRAIRAIIIPDANLFKNLKDSEDRESVINRKEGGLCYEALGIVHSMWAPIPGRFKDYIASPKQNGYQSLHTTVIGLDGEPIEVQIRSQRMHEIAEYGVAAHWAYKEGREDEDAVAKRLEWIKKHILDFNSLSEDADSFVEIVKNDLFTERVFCFTPQGKIINLPRGSTPIDFAYHVHTEIGHKCGGARVDGKMVPLSYKLENGQRIEIITNKNQQGPSPDWVNIVKTRSAIQKIRQHFRNKERHDYVDVGRKRLERALKRKKLHLPDYTSTVKLEQAARILLRSENVDDLLLALANDRIQPTAVYHALKPQEVEIKKPEPEKASKVPGCENDIYIEGFLDAPLRLSLCCKPAYNDPIVGYVTRGRGVTIHQVSCSNIKKALMTEEGRFLTAQWKARSDETYSVDFEIRSDDRVGLLGEIMTVFSNMNRTVGKVNVEVVNEEAQISLRLEVKNPKEIEQIEKGVKQINGVTKIYQTKMGIKKKSLVA